MIAEDDHFLATGADRAVLCLDSGYTSTRMGYWIQGSLQGVRRWPTPTKRAGPAAGRAADAVRDHWLAVLTAEIRAGIEANPHVEAVGLSIAGMVSTKGCIAPLNAIWGRAAGEITPRVLAERFGRPVMVVNDLHAATHRYAHALGAGRDKVVVVSVSSGIGCKTFVRALGGVVADPLGRAGEIGLAVIDFDEDALTNDNGSLPGILGNYASGTAFPRLLRRLAASPDGADFETSILKSLLRRESEDLVTIDRVKLNRIAVEAFKSGDSFVASAVKASASALAKALHIILLYEAPSLIVLCGGFARSLGPMYRVMLVEELSKLVSLIYSYDDLCSLVVLGDGSDDDCLVGLGLMMAELGNQAGGMRARFAASTAKESLI